MTVNAMHPDLRTVQHLESLARAVEPAAPLRVGGPSSLSFSKTNKNRRINTNPDGANIIDDFNLNHIYFFDNLQMRNLPLSNIKSN